MNEAQTFLFLLAVLGFGWIGFMTNYAPEKFEGIFVIAFFLGNIAMGFFAVMNLAFLLGKNF